jgi:hypothetical protein
MLVRNPEDLNQEKQESLEINHELGAQNNFDFE